MSLVPDKPGLSVEEVKGESISNLQNATAFEERLREGFDYVFMTPSDTEPVHRNNLEDKFCRTISGLTPDQIKEAALEREQQEPDHNIEPDHSMIPGST